MFARTEGPRRSFAGWSRSPSDGPSPSKWRSGRRCEPAVEHGEEGGRLLEVHGVAGAGDEEHRHVEIGQPRPQRLLGAGAGEAQAGGEAGEGVAAAVVEVGI